MGQARRISPAITRWVIFLLIALLGLALRLPQLAARPMHTDEAVNAYILGQVLAGKPFPYDTRDRHGPALAALALPLAKIQGAKSFTDLTESELRLTTVAAGTITILLFGAAADLFGLLPCIFAALLFACAPLPVYYDRYFIHESLFTAATFGFILTAWRAGKNRSVTQGALAGACAALMLACKETAVLHFAALALAALCLWLCFKRAELEQFSFERAGLQSRRKTPSDERGFSRRGNARASMSLIQRHLNDAKLRTAALAAIIAFLVLSALLFSWFGTNWSTLSALPHAIPNLLARAGGEGHQKPFWYYAKLLTGGWSGGLISILAFIGLFQTLKLRESSPYALLAVYSILLAAIYSLIPYKTPWLALNLWLPIALFAGFAVESCWRLTHRSIAALPLGFALVVLTFAIGHDTQDRAFLHPSDETNPYAYAHTSEDLLGLSPLIEQVAREQAITTPRIAVIAADAWPLPWYLRHFPQTGFWQPGQPVADADFYITDANTPEQYKDQLRNYHADFFGLRPGVLILLWSPLPK